MTPDAVSTDWLTQLISHHGLLLGLVAVFFGGLALNLTPCVYPMIPVTLAFFSHQAGSRVRRGVFLPLAYVLGISINYAVLGFAAAKTGALFGSWLQQPAVLVGIAAIVVILSLSMFGLYDLRPPRALTDRIGHASAGLGGAFVMGLMVGIVAAPCIGPFILSLLLLVSRQADPLAGFLVFFALGLGMGAPYALLGLAAQRAARLPKSGAWLVWSKKLLGVILLGLALYLVRPLLPKAAVHGAAAALIGGAGLYLGWLDRPEQRSWRFQLFQRVIGSALLLAAAVVLWPRSAPAPGAAWVPYTAATLEAVQREHRPIIVDVYADWCIPCVEMDHTTFRHPDVVHALASVATLRIDATHEVTPEAEQLLSTYNVYGAPTVLFFDRQGKERRELRLTGFATVEELLSRLRRIL